MINRLIASLGLLMWLANFGYCQDDGILINVPKRVDAGNEFLMVISVPENYMQGISRLQIELPNGFTAKAKKIDNADFKMKDQKATFQWLNFPINKIVEVSLSITVVNTIEGYFVIKGVADWISRNEPLHANINPKVLTVNKSSNDEGEFIIRQNETKISYDDFESVGVACIRQVPYLKDDEIIVNLLVSKGDFNRYGKIQEKIPVGYKIENIKSHNAIFVYNQRQQLVKYMWMKMPDEAKFIVSYKLIPEKGIDDSNPFIIYGAFHYAVNNQTKTVDIQERGIDLGGFKTN